MPEKHRFFYFWVGKDVAGKDFRCSTKASTSTSSPYSRSHKRRLISISVNPSGKDARTIALAASNIPLAIMIRSRPERSNNRWRTTSATCGSVSFMSAYDLVQQWLHTKILGTTKQVWHIAIGTQQVFYVAELKF